MLISTNVNLSWYDVHKYLLILHPNVHMIYHILIYLLLVKCEGEFVQFVSACLKVI